MVVDDNEFRKLDRQKAVYEKTTEHREELAGSRTGYLSRTSAVDESSPAGRAATEKRKQDRRLLSALELAMRDPAYAKLYNEVDETLREHEQAAQAAISRLTSQFEKQQDEMAERMDGANRLPDGTPVFLSEDGNIYTADKRMLDETERESLVLKDGAMTYEELKSRRDAIAETQTLLNEVRTYQAELGEMRHRLENRDNRLSPDELEDMRESLAEQAISTDQKISTQPDSPRSEGVTVTVRPL